MSAANNEFQAAQLTIGGDDECAAKIAPMWQQLDIEPEYPLATSAAAGFLDQLGYEVTEDLLAQWACNETIPGVSRHQGRFSWGARSLFLALLYCEAYRRWQPLHERHLEKMSAVERLEMECRLAGRTNFQDLDKVDCNSMVTMLDRTADAETRHILATGLKTKLRFLGVLDL